MVGLCLLDPQRLGFLPVLAQLPDFGNQHLTAFAQGLAARVDDLCPAAR